MKKTSLRECEETRLDRGEFAFSRKRLGRAAGGKALAASWFEVPPGKKAFPFHYHLANEEAFFVLEGEGVVRLGDDEHPLRAGDYFTFPAGLPAHQIFNRSKAPLRFLTLSTMIEPEVCVYPDSGKLGVIARSSGIEAYHRAPDAVDYYEGEE